MKVSIEGHVICGVISDSFSCDFINYPEMNTVLLDLELNFILTLLTKMITKSKFGCVLFAFYRALIYNNMESKELNERCLEELQFVISNRGWLPVKKSQYFEYML